MWFGLVGLVFNELILLCLCPYFIQYCFLMAYMCRLAYMCVRVGSGKFSILHGLFHCGIFCMVLGLCGLGWDDMEGVYDSILALCSNF